MDWTEILIPCTAQSVDEVAALVVDEVPAAGAGVEIRGHLVVFWAEASQAEDACASATAAAATWAQNGIDVDVGGISSRSAVPEAEWRDAWKRYFHIVRLTRQVVVVPSWERNDYKPATDDLALYLDPGMAFGTGAHDSTRLVLEEMQQLADDGMAPPRILDVGAGSGILSLAALRLFPGSTCVAVDNDPLALSACQDNARDNGLTLAIKPAPLAPDDHADLVLANIQAHVLREIKTALFAACVPGAVLILSGILTPQAEPLAEEFVELGFVVLRTRTGRDGQWTAIVLQR